MDNFDILQNQMTARVNVIGVGDNNINGSLVVKQKDKATLSGSFRYNAITHTNDTPGSLVVKREDFNEFNGSLKVRPHNKMVGTVNVIEPPIKKIQFAPIKDATLASNAPYLQFGQGSELAIGKVAESEDYRAILAFNISAVDLENLENLSYAKLRLNIVRPVKKATGLVLYTTSKSDWSETGVNWANQPSPLKMVATANIVAGATYVEFNLSNFFKENAEINQVFSFIVRDSSDNLLTVPITFGSRETDDAPIFEYAYQYFPPSAGVNDIRGYLTPRFQNIKILAGSLHITNGLYHDDLQGLLFINKKQNANEIVGNLTVCKKNTNEFVGSLVITEKPARTELLGSIVIKQIAEPYINGSLTIVSIQNQTNLPGSIIIRQKDDTALNGSMSITSKIKYSNLSGSIVVKQDGGRNLDGSILITQKEKHNDFAGSIISKQKDAAFLNGLFTLVGIEEHNEFMGSLKVRATDLVDLRGSLVLNSKEKEHDFGGSVVVKQLDKATLDGSVVVPRVDKEADIQGHIIVQQHDSKILNGSFIVKQYDYGDIVGTLRSRPKWGEDMEGSVVVTYGSSYAFIM